jgi:hypothetical protein
MYKFINTDLKEAIDKYGWSTEREEDGMLSQSEIFAAGEKQGYEVGLAASHWDREETVFENGKQEGRQEVGKWLEVIVD